MIGQSEKVVPADRLMYALRDVTGTVESIPLITASIMSKKFAEGARALVFDVKTGSGAFMKSRKDAEDLARSLARTGRVLDRGVISLITDMDQPLGRKIGNFLEVEESVECLQGRGPQDLVELTIRLTAWMLVLGGVRRDCAGAEEMVRARLADGSAWKRFTANVEFQGGDVECVMQPQKGPRARIEKPVVSPGEGFVKRIDAYGVGLASVVLGAGRSRKTDAVLPGVGIILHKIQGDSVRRGEELALVRGEDLQKVESAVRMAEAAYTLSDERSLPGARVLEEITGE
jgi:pyrimidine-nucleoside phosphorylase